MVTVGAVVSNATGLSSSQVRNNMGNNNMNIFFIVEFTKNKIK